MTNRDLVVAHLGKPWSLVRTVADRPGHDRRYAMAGERPLSFTHRLDFDDGLARTARWYLDNETWWRAVRSADWHDHYTRQYSERLAASSAAD